MLTVLSCQRNPIPDIIPIPEDIRMGTGSFRMPSVCAVSLPDSTFMSLIQFAESQFPESDFHLDGKGEINVVSDTSVEQGAYVLSVTSRRLTIKVADYAGAIAAFATLGQSMDSEGNIPVMKIVDSPRMEWRGFMLDVSRHFFSKDEVKELLSLMATYKFNRFHWHLSDDQGWRIEIKAFPELTSKGAWRDYQTHKHDQICAGIAEENDDPSFVLDASKITDKGYGGYYTQDDIREVVAYAATLGIDVIPEIDMPGHSLKVVESYPWLSCGAKAGWGQHFSVPLCPGNDEALAFAKAVYSEIFDLFPYGYVHIGADEVERSHWKKCEKCQARMRALGLEDEAGLQAWFVGQMQDFFEANGKTLIGWDEIVAGGVSKDAVVMWWRGWRPDSRTEAVENGNDVIISSSEYLYLSGDQNRNSLMKVYDWDPVADGLSDHENQVLGMQAHVWTELCPSWENACGRIFPRLFAVSETAWSMPSRKDRDGFLKRVNTHLRRFDSQGINYRIPDISGFCDVNVFVDSTTIEISRPFDDVVVRYTLDGSVPRSDSPVYEAPITVKSSAVLHFRPYTSSGMPGDIYRAEYLPASYQEPLLDTTDELACGLKTDWYEYRGESCDSITTVAFNSSYVTEGIYIPEEVKGNIGLVFEGYVNIPEDGIYSFYTYSDDGSFIKINDEMVVANDGPHSRVEKNGQAALKKGLHKLEARYFDSSGGILEAGFILPDGTRRKFTAGDFFH